jgi:hypothetical protein
MAETKPLPKYLCHKEVEALKILQVTWDPRSQKYLLHVEGDYPPLVVDRAWVDRFGPTRGSYWVKYKDGYTSVSPERAFEEGYTAGSSVTDSSAYFVAADIAAARAIHSSHCVVRGRYVGNCIVIDEVVRTHTPPGRPTVEIPMRWVPGTDPPRYEPA